MDLHITFLENQCITDKRFETERKPT